MNVALLLGVAVGVAAPGLKDPPKKGGSIVGEWEPVSLSMGGKTLSTVPAGMRYEFTADGKWITRREGSDSKSPALEFKFDPKPSPATIDVTSTTAARNLTGIYKLEGDTLTICWTRDSERPKEFESPDGSRAMLMVLKRAKKKE